VKTGQFQTAHGRKVLWHGEDKAVRPMQVGEMILRQALDETRYFEGTPGLLLRSSAVQDASYAADLTSACAMALTALQL
jgi:hypothetical protein